MQEELLYTRQLCTFWTSETFVSGKLCFLCIMHEFGHRSITAGPFGYRSSVQRALNNTETVLFGVCFAFLMCIHTEVELS